MKLIKLTAALLAASILTGIAQEDIKNKPAVAAADIDTATDWFVVGDASVTNGSSMLRRLPLVEYWKKIGGTNVSATELGYLDGVTSAIQTQLNAKEAGLGNPASNGYVLSSTTGGTRSWVAPSGGSFATLTGQPTDNANMATALNAKLNQGPALYGDFTQHADGSFSVGTAPKVGNIWRWSTASNVAPKVENGALVGNAGQEQYYFGNDVGEAIRSMTFDVDFQPGGGGALGAVTLSFDSEPLLAATSVGAPILNAGMLHFQFLASGLASMGFSESYGANYENMQQTGVSYPVSGVYPYSSNTAGGSIKTGKRVPITVTFQGADVLITFLGKTHVYRHPGAKNYLTLSGLPSDNDTFVVGSQTYTWKNTLASSYQVKIGATAAISATNAVAALNAGAGSGTAYGAGTVAHPTVNGIGDGTASGIIEFRAKLAGPNGNSIVCTESTTNGVLTYTGGVLAGGERTPITAMGPPRYWYFEALKSTSNSQVYPRLFRVWANAPELDATAQNEWLAAISTTGDFVLDNNTTFQNYLTVDGRLRIGNPSLTATKLTAMMVNTNGGNGFAASAQSVANQTTATAWLGMLYQHGYTAGATESITLMGTFGANSNIKRLILREGSAGLGFNDLFDSGDITQNGGVWRLVMRRAVLTGASNTHFCEFWSSSTGTVMNTVAFNRGGTFSPMALHAAGVAVGDVTVSYSQSTVTGGN